MEIVFLCDRKKCGEICPNTSCYYTTDITHAKNFCVEGTRYGTDEIIYRELDDEEKPMNEQIKTNATNETSVEEKNSRKKFRDLPNDDKRFYNLLRTLFNVCTLAGFRIEGRVKIRDLKTGKVWE